MLHKNSHGHSERNDAKKILSKNILNYGERGGIWHVVYFMMNLSSFHIFIYHNLSLCLMDYKLFNKYPRTRGKYEKSQMVDI